MTFLKNCAAVLQRPSRVCELGSRDVNGSPREVFQDFRNLYVGVDLRPGPGVDVVADASDWNLGASILFDLVVCTECLEHAPNAALICDNAFRLLRSGGVFLVTAAGVKRALHSVNGDELPEGEFYRNVSEADLSIWLKDFAVVLIQERDGIDIYALAVKGEA